LRPEHNLYVEKAFARFGGLVIARAITRCPTCGDLDIRLLGGGVMRCRTCGVIPVPGRTLLPQGVLRLTARSLILSTAVACADLVPAVLVGGGNALGVYPSVMFASGIAVVIFGGIRGGAPRAGGVYTSSGEIQARFGPSSGTFAVMLGLGGLILIAIGLFLRLMIG